MKIQEQSEVLYSLSDVTLIPTELSTIYSRSQCNTNNSNIEQDCGNFLPIIASPMSSVVSVENYKEFHSNRISCIIPRNIPIDARLALMDKVFCAFGLQEIEEYFLESGSMIYNYDQLHILIDIANGHMAAQLEVGKRLKKLYGDRLLLMGGNIANPLTYRHYDSAGFDYVRVGIAGGSRCLTGTQTGIYCPMASLISDTSEEKNKCNGRCKIVADGGISSYADVIKCLALGADFVMLGKVFAKALEAAGDIVDRDGNYLNERPNELHSGLMRDYYGMSTKKAQSEILGYSTVEEAKEKERTNLKTSEGKLKRVNIEYKLSGWVENMDAYLKSAMSYSNARNLTQFKENAICRVISNDANSGINNK